MKYLKLTLFLCLLPVLSFAEIKVTDGDSLEIGERRIRLNGIDAPEFMQTCLDANDNEYACGQQALIFLADFVKDKEIDCQCQSQKDKYERELCECFANNISLNEILVASGWAMSYRDTKYDTIQNEAQINKRGIWQGKFMRPALYRVLERHKTENKPNLQ